MYTPSSRLLRSLRTSYHQAIRSLSFIRQYSIAQEQGHATPLRRSYLYVPASSERMLQKSLVTGSDIIIYDLEDSIAPSEEDKNHARKRLADFLTRTAPENLPHPSRIAVRVNSTHTPFFERDIVSILTISSVRTLVLPKIHSVEDLEIVTDAMEAFGRAQGTINLIASIESALALHNVGAIASWKSVYGPEKGGELRALLFAAEDYCADTSIIRTASRQELLYPRSQIAITAKAFGLDAIDMVCVNYRDLEFLRDECADGRRLGFSGKQAIHPTQVDIIQSTFVPTEQEILRAATIVHRMAQAHAEQKGAFGLDLGDSKGGKEMIDAPMLKQAEKSVQLARAAGLPIPKIS
ncbi:citrate lyase beta subunit [Multifurca ochricompacta]|uniref:Citrate lyase beta subunit n=1 Tax=Multifurca ochricompacta TaxID=376703 RepID=A0AAD4M9C0_9AGAM|nr:citrate lyase beta subunit [Multifurca ochricompacta]